MKEIYLGEREELKSLPERIVVDRIPPKSTYWDRDATGVVGSRTFVVPSIEAMEKIFGKLDEGSEE